MMANPTPARKVDCVTQVRTRTRHTQATVLAEIDTLVTDEERWAESPEKRSKEWCAVQAGPYVIATRLMI